MEPRKSFLVALAITGLLATGPRAESQAVGEQATQAAATVAITTPTELIDTCAQAYRTMDLELYAQLFANVPEHGVGFRFVLYEPDAGETEWGYDEEMRIHRRMFHPETLGCDAEPVAAELWLRAIDIELTPLAAFTERFDLYRSEQNPLRPLDRKQWRASEAVYATDVTWHTQVGTTMRIVGQARFTVIEDLQKGSGDGDRFLIYIWEDLGPGGTSVARAKS